MKFTSLFTRLGLLALGFILVAVLNDDSVWADPATTTPTTAGLADSLLTEWGFALLVLGLLMAMAMMKSRDMKVRLIFQLKKELKYTTTKSYRIYCLAT